MIAVLTGDIRQSETQNPEKWLPRLIRFLESLGHTPLNWEIYRGGEFQLKLTDPHQAVLIALQLKALFRMIEHLDVVIGIGLGEENYSDAQVSRSNGKVYINSGRIFEKAKREGVNLKIESGNTVLDKPMNLIFELALTFMDKWSVVSAETVFCLLQSPSKSQLELAEEFGVSQSTISQRLKRANFELLMKINDYYEEVYKTYWE